MHGVNLMKSVIAIAIRSIANSSTILDWRPMVKASLLEPRQSKPTEKISVRNFLGDRVWS
jgi:hypothetical protein